MQVIMCFVQDVAKIARPILKDNIGAGMWPVTMDAAGKAEVEIVVGVVEDPDDLVVDGL